MAQDFESRCENCIIRQLNTLKALKKEELKRISDSKISHKVKKGERLFEEGERLSGVFCVRDGVSKLSKMSDNGKDQIVKLATKGEVMGQRSVITDEQTNLSAIALDDMEVCFIPKSEITDNLHNNTEFTNAVLKHMANELKLSDDHIVDMAQKTVNQRVAEAILYLHEKFGTDDEGYLKLILTRSDIADIVGTATELCIRILAKFKKQNLISTQGKRIKIEDRPGLKNIANGL